jgi:transcription antitermination factor NusG
MPILAPEPCVHPLDLLTRGAADHPIDARWYVLHTKARQEKAVMRDLIEREAACYMPVHQRSSLVRGKRVQSNAPLFAGYVFLLGDDDDRLSALQTNRVVQVLSVEDQARLHQDLARIEQLILSGAPVWLESRIRPGRRVRVKSGSLRGLEGTVLHRRGEQRLIVSIDFLQQGASVAVDDFWVESID